MSESSRFNDALLSETIEAIDSAMAAAELSGGRVGYPEFLRKANPEFVWTPLVQHVAQHVDLWINNHYTHLSIHLPPQHAKTSLGPRNAVPAILHRYPKEWAAITSYGSELAHSRSYDARAKFVETGGRLAAGAGKVNEWRTVQNGGCWSAGTAAGQTGRSVTWGFIDDGDKDWADAINSTSQRKKRDWYRGTFRARESMFATDGRPMKLLQTVTRWAQEDLAGFILDLGHEVGEDWAVLVLPALYDPAIREEYAARYPNFRVLEDFRTQPGEPIYPERVNAQEWEQRKRLMGPVIWDTEFQQRPRGAQQGGQFEAAWFNRLDFDPAFHGEEPNENHYQSSCRAWDLAATEGGGDWTAGAKLGLLEDGGLVVRHVARAQLSSGGVEQLIAACMILDGPHVTIRIPEDPAAGGTAWAEGIVRFLRKVASECGVPLPQIVVKRPRKVGSATRTAKAERARFLVSLATPPSEKIPGAVSYVAEQWAPALSDRIEEYGQRCRRFPVLAEIEKKALVVGDSWQSDWLREMQAFTGQDGKTDDQVDATVDAAEELTPPLEDKASGALAHAPWL